MTTHTAAPLLPAEVLARLFAADATRPRLTWYDDEPGPTAGERIELSARVLTNWVAKAANLLQDDLSAEPGTTVGLDLPAHWRAVYWALAAWSVGAEVVVGEAATGADVLVTASPEAAAAHGGDAVLVSLPALARSHPQAADAPAAVDEARELSTHGDVFVPLADPEPSDVALATVSGSLTYGEVVVADDAWGAQPRVALRGSPEDVLRGCLAAWAADGSVVLERGPVGAGAPGRHASEGVTVEAGA
ncbi:TIGR03089 family protein [Intrasporangium sp. YIM S08009]|uniref:TIGR03089 family protein n=1 Tax=Intrasporangium zincisolvens TaxID=3080018 RepID=UPI002B05A0F8|nr:TIGR03089 family protein [Intrasporangium sp. YIM S08009]